MPKLSSSAWMIHDLGLATSIGGTLFGRVALQPALHQIGRPEERDLVSAAAWRRFSWLNLLGHAAFALPWFAGRKMLSGKQVSRRARPLVHLKDVLVGVSLVTGVASVILGRRLAERGIQGRGAQAMAERERLGDTHEDVLKTRAIKRSVGTLGIINMIATAGVGVLTTALAMEGNKSARFIARARCLP